MNERTDHIVTTDDRDRDVVVAQPVITPSEPDHRIVMADVDRPSKAPAFFAGFVTALVLAAIAFVAFLAVSDSDDDGNLDVDVPAVQVETDTDTGG